jgi:phosphoribosylanthranilate isomerase
MSLWIKICGNTSLADARLALEAGADALGFVFAPSPRHVTASEAAGIASHLPATVEKIGVFVDAGLNEIYAAVRMCRLTGVQLHFESGSELPAQLHKRLGPELRILRVVHFGPDAMQQATAIAADPYVDAVLVDSRTATALGGTGVPFDWVAARETVFQDAGLGKRLIAAGGLNPGNVVAAIAALRPWGVDVASGVEATPGHKDQAKVRQFVTLARAAARELAMQPAR